MEKETLHQIIKKVITAISLFSGAGGGTLGLSYANVKELLAIDNWDIAKRVFEANFKDDRFIPFWQADILALTAADILRRLLIDAGELGLMLLSPPCQGFSVAKGKLNPLDPRNLLFLHSINLIAGVRPKVFVIENVPGMTDDRNIAIFNEIKLRIIEQLCPHYEVRCYKLLALNYNTPQKRFRLIFVGYLREFGVTPTPPRPDFDAINGLRVADISPEITAFKVGQSRKIIKHNSHFMNTVTASGELIVYTDGEERTISIEQDKRFATFPDWYQVPKDIKSKDAHKLFGNTIPPMFMKAIVEHILSEIGDKL